MDNNGSIEQRVAALEREVAELKRRASGDNGDWPDRLFGGMRDIPEEEFNEFVRLGKEFRNSQTDPE
jgi:hypothetical protein